MNVLLVTLLLATADPEFPEVEEPLVEDVDPALTEEPVGPDDEEGVVDDITVATPVSPAPAAPAPAPAAPPIQGITVRSNTAPKPQPPAVAPVAQPARPPITGLGPMLWGDTQNTVQARYGERPLLERGNGVWFIRDVCEGYRATILYEFQAANGLESMVCLFSEGIYEPGPDRELYKVLREKLAGHWGRPVAVNEPADVNQDRAAVWQEKPGRATLSYFPNSKAVQLRVERIAAQP